MKRNGVLKWVPEIIIWFVLKSGAMRSFPVEMVGKGLLLLAISSGGEKNNNKAIDDR